jgi:hypothetical protein
MELPARLLKEIFGIHPSIQLAFLRQAHRKEAPNRSARFGAGFWAGLPPKRKLGQAGCVAIVVRSQRE